MSVVPRFKKPWFVPFLCSAMSVDNTGVFKELHLSPFLGAIAPTCWHGKGSEVKAALL